jgi:hypothetical protein
MRGRTARVGNGPGRIILEALTLLPYGMFDTVKRFRRMPREARRG